jgi:hypothetical protein
VLEFPARAIKGRRNEKDSNKKERSQIIPVSR